VSSRRRKRDAGYQDARAAVLARADGRCEASAALDCTGRCEQVHHLAGRTGPDPHRLENLLAVCDPCHRWIGENPAHAMALGLTRTRHTRRDAL
jgi:hypothetical protein